MYDLAIIGGGPAGISAAIYASRKLLKTVVIAYEMGGQSVVSEDIQNWVGFPSISGKDLVKAFDDHLNKYKGDVVETATGENVTKLEKKDSGFVITTESGKTYEAKAVLIASGAHRRKLEVKGADLLEHKGLTYCASCDGPLFSGRDVVVIGGGNAAFETAAQLLAYTKSVTIINRSAEYRADPITVKKVLSHPNAKTIVNADLEEVVGDKFVSGLRYMDRDKNESKLLDVQGIFVEIGLVPSTEFVKGLVELDQYNRIVVDPKNQQTKVPGIWAAGDCTNELYHQNNIAAGDAVKALEDIYVHLKAK